MTIKAIETIYNGIRFRSRLEARWAIFFDKSGVKWDYEPEGFTDGTLCYLPDFWLPKFKFYVEIKPEGPTDEEIKKAMMLVNGTGKPLSFFIGKPSTENIVLCVDEGRVTPTIFRASGHAVFAANNYRFGGR